MTKQITLSDIHSFIQDVRDQSKEYLIFTNDGVTLTATPIVIKAGLLNKHFTFEIKCNIVNLDIKRAWVASALNGNWTITECNVFVVFKCRYYSTITTKSKTGATFWNEAKDDVTMEPKDFDQFGDALKYSLGRVKAAERPLSEKHEPFKIVGYDFSKL